MLPQWMQGAECQTKGIEENSARLQLPAQGADRLQQLSERTVGGSNTGDALTLAANDRRTNDWSTSLDEP